MMNKAFESYIIKKFGSRYDLTRDQDGYYIREVVKRMFDVWKYKSGDLS